MISIILPTFNRLDYLHLALESVFAQTYEEWELIVADDGSDAATREYLRSLTSRHRIERIWLSHTGNPASVRNAALREARAEYVAFLDSDDLWAPRKLELQMARLRQRPDCQWSYTAFTRVDRQGVPLAEERDRLWTPHEGAIFDEIVRGEASIRTPSVVAARRLVIEAGWFDETMRAAEDYDLWMRLALRSDVALVDEPLVSVRLHDHNLTQDWASGFAGRDHSLAKMQDHVDGRRRSLLRRERARNAAKLASTYAARHEWRDAWRTSWSSLSYSWPYREWWKRTLTLVTK